MNSNKREKRGKEEGEMAKGSPPSVGPVEKTRKPYPVSKRSCVDRPKEKGKTLGKVTGNATQFVPLRKETRIRLRFSKEKEL